MKENLKKYILDSIFVVSKQPVLFRDLLEANCLFNEGMLVDGAKLNFKFRHSKTYKIYALICILFLFPLLVLTHHFLSNIDAHISILVTVAVTSVVFIGFDMFKVWARKEKSRELIKKAWAVHFPYFTYEKYSTKVEEIYNEAIKNDIPKKELEQYVLEKLILQKESAE
ncbi:hypothetical protein CCAL9344_00350 [Campylobacter sp. RM9344]|uniref:Uncharacterized protein n=1 Tax=Campylobacter californiensis TaxID=1032243 RepID=A0AAW3ZRC7_9BACT|nr:MULTISPECIES: hypothetical protein [unclassified Campylobacter]MBE2983800.1 hypothetical protein [Campylobacter sp. RM6883]MBE2985636.1 hypothetical protein [Campylobacter sp. RM12919]MBE2987335.1 hypothetical protein [Campylobacter sp. RM12920]MBE2994338.1 hypothetical protein [Campylobacter sp. RM6913]MBE3022202.1 hypothetical protein [Campylobacter sp. 7477a]MBE3028646.1 hypothetical protein [Campylobacter sp. RM9344]